jgi:glycosyltransferase involved in cell wall biosynthesis
MSEKKIFEDKKVMLAHWGCGEDDHYSKRDWIPTFREIFGSLVVFGPRENYFLYGRKGMNELFIETVTKEKPDYIIFSLSYEEFEIDTLMKIKEVSPKTITINLFGDDNWRFDDWSRYYAPFFDYLWVSEKDFSDYNQDGIKGNIQYLLGTNEEIFKPLNLRKNYDVTFIGMPVQDRAEFIKFLVDNGIKVKIFGKGWEKYPELAEIYGGFVSSEEMVRIINQSKINLNFSKTLLHEGGRKNRQFKGRVLEAPACKSFMLTEDFNGIDKFFKNSRPFAFDNKEELLKKVNYYLNHDLERNKISEITYKEIIPKYSWKSMFISFFKSIGKKIKNKSINLKPTERIICLSERDIFLDKDELIKRLKNADYVYIKGDGSESLKYREFFQGYSLKKSGKKISCCDSYVYSNLIGDYLLFQSKKAFKSLSKEKFSKLVDISQLLFEKDYFAENLKIIRDCLRNKDFNFIDETNTIFVSMPLVRVNAPIALWSLDSNSVKDAFRLLFMFRLYSIYKNKTLSLYPLLLMFSLVGKKNLLKILFDKKNLSKGLSS